ncbi:5767_t:CDS:2 [Acaulospora colombiana]|uniref:5767_t:CDS:1 n=1 Tax=Acaulospora colombiana TaxID=27376 RepID=A0ACA9KJ02_9GLOM|nr:5767_t:CDS:2 [Acaulospora colombiana]
MSSKDWYFADVDSDNYDEDSDEDFILREGDVPPDTSDTSEEESDDNYETDDDFEDDNNFDGLASSEYDNNQNDSRGDKKKGKQVSRKTGGRKRSNGINNGENDTNEPGSHVSVNDIDSSNCAESSFDVSFLNDMNSSFSNGTDEIRGELNGGHPSTNETVNSSFPNSMNDNVNGIGSNGFNDTNGVNDTNKVHEQGSPRDKSHGRSRRTSPSLDNSQACFAIRISNNKR